MAQAVHEQQRREELRQTNTRLTAPRHIVTTRFEEHRKIEGLVQDRTVPDFYGCDRLWRMDTAYGRIQMGYHPGKGQSFLFATIKTSVLDTAAAAHQHRLDERSQMRALKTGTPNTVFSARRRPGSAVLLYKAENQPWSRRSLEAYLRRADLEALRKTMPFLEYSEAKRLEQTRDERKALEEQVRQALAQGNREETAAVRLRQRSLSWEQNALQAVLARKQAQAQMFFHRLNLAFDGQKARMFAYYRRVRALRAEAAARAAAALNSEGTNRNDNNDADD